MAAPGDDRFFCVVVAGEVVFRNMGMQSCRFVPQIFAFQGISVIFRVSRYKNLAAALVGYCEHTYPVFFTGGEDFQFRYGFHILPVYGSMARMGRHEAVVKPRRRIEVFRSFLWGKMPEIFSGRRCFCMP